MKKVVILGGGYGGMLCIKALMKGKTKESFHVYLVDRMPHHTLKTEFFAVAAGTSDEKHVSITFPKHKNLTYVQGEVEKIDREEKQVVLTDSEQETLSYDYLVIALGCEDNYHGIEGAKEYTQSVQTPKKAQAAFTEVKKLHKPSSIIVIGGGLTGVELASELQEHYDHHQVHIIEHGKSILAPFNSKIQNHAVKWFNKRHVKIINEARIEKLEEGIVHLGEGQTIRGRVIFWAGGIMPSHIVQESGLELDRGRRVVVNTNNQSSDEHVFVIGDCASSTLPASAQLAEQHGVSAGKTIRAFLNGKPAPKLGAPKNLGMFGSLGKYNGFGRAFGVTVTGFIPRMMKHVINIYYRFTVK